MMSASSSSSFSVKPMTEQEDRQLRVSLVRMLESRILAKLPPTRSLRCFQTLDKLVSNKIDNPDEQRFKIVRAKNPTFMQTVLDVDGAVDALTLVGTTKRIINFEEVYVLSDCVERLVILQAIVRELAGRATARIEIANHPEGKKSEELRRKERVLMQIEEDRARCALKQERERAARQRRQAQTQHHHTEHGSNSAISEPTQISSS